jgi:hypothetical protein
MTTCRFIDRVLEKKHDCGEYKSTEAMNDAFQEILSHDGAHVFAAIGAAHGVAHGGVLVVTLTDGKRVMSTLQASPFLNQPHADRPYIMEVEIRYQYSYWTIVKTFLKWWDDGKEFQRRLAKAKPGNSTDLKYCQSFADCINGIQKRIQDIAKQDLYHLKRWTKVRQHFAERLEPTFRRSVYNSMPKEMQTLSKSTNYKDQLVLDKMFYKWWTNEGYEIVEQKEDAESMRLYMFDRFLRNEYDEHPYMFFIKYQLEAMAFNQTTGSFLLSLFPSHVSSLIKNMAKNDPERHQVSLFVRPKEQEIQLFDSNGITEETNLILPEITRVMSTKLNTFNYNIIAGHCGPQKITKDSSCWLWSVLNFTATLECPKLSSTTKLFERWSEKGKDYLDKLLFQFGCWLNSYIKENHMDLANQFHKWFRMVVEGNEFFLNILSPKT